MERLPVGTKEYLIVDVSDRLDNLTTLDGVVITFDVLSEDIEVNPMYESQPASNDGMSVKCLIDTTDWDPDEYSLFIDFIAAPEEPRLGPFKFKVE
jgi:hypothetical protein